MSDPVNPAPQTGPQEGRCGAVRERDAHGNPIRWCRNWPMVGQARCRLDGGAAPQALAAAERRQQEAAARGILARYGVPQPVEWHTALQGQLDEAFGCVLAMRDLVQRLAPEDLAWGRTEVAEIGGSQFPGVNTTHAAGIHPWVLLYGQERDRLIKLAVDCGKLGLEARRQAFAEREGGEFVAALRDVLTDLSAALAAGEITTVDPADPAVLRVVSGRLRTLAVAS